MRTEPEKYKQKCTHKSEQVSTLNKEIIKGLIRKKEKRILYTSCDVLFNQPL